MSSESGNGIQEGPSASSRDAGRASSHRPRSTPRWKFEPEWKDRPNPPALNAVGRRTSIAILGTIGFGFLCMAVLKVSGVSPAAGFVVVVAGPWIPIVLGFSAMTKLAAKVRAANYSLCMHCLYDLRHVPDETCPECGKEFNLEDVQALWERSLSGMQP